MRPPPAWEQAWVVGVIVPYVRPEATLLSVLCSVGTVVTALSALAILGLAFLRGRREAAGFIGLTLLAVTIVHDALRGVGWASGPPIAALRLRRLRQRRHHDAPRPLHRAPRPARGARRHLKDRARELSRDYTELRAAQDELVTKKQLTAVGELSAVVAHEVRNPLAIITNAVATLRRKRRSRTPIAACSSASSTRRARA